MYTYICFVACEILWACRCRTLLSLGYCWSFYTLKTHGLKTPASHIWHDLIQTRFSGMAIYCVWEAAATRAERRTERGVAFQSAMDLDHMLSSRSKNSWDVSKIIFFSGFKMFQVYIVRPWNSNLQFLSKLFGFLFRWSGGTAFFWTVMHGHHGMTTLGTFASWDVPQPDQSPFTSGTERKRFEEWRI